MSQIYVTKSTTTRVAIAGQPIQYEINLSTNRSNIYLTDVLPRLRSGNSWRILRGGDFFQIVNTGSVQRLESKPNITVGNYSVLIQAQTGSLDAGSSYLNTAYVEVRGPRTELYPSNDSRISIVEAFTTESSLPSLPSKLIFA